MKTFEEYKFTIKHNNIYNNNIYNNDKIHLEDLQVGDWFYTVSEFSCNHCQITKIVNNNTRFENNTSLYFYDGIEEISWEIYDKYMINDYTCSSSEDNWAVTTDENVAKKYAKEFGYIGDIIEFPAE